MPRHSACLACGYHVSYPLYHPDDQPLMALNLPRSREQAAQAPRYPMEFVSCARCGHIYNAAFDYSKVPYQTDSNLMYNSGSGWQVYIQELIGQLHEKYPFTSQNVLEIGCGDGHFLRSLRERFPGLNCVGFEPGIDPQRMQGNSITVVNGYFEPERDLPQYRPSLLVCRHVIEHLEAPRDFVANIAYWCNMHGIFPDFLIEVPRIDNAVAESRINDYLYEHVSNFSDASLRLMLEQAGYDILEYRPAYRDEVLVALARPRKLPLPGIKSAADGYRQALAGQHESVRAALGVWQANGRRIAFWGGTGKGAAFLNAFGLDAGRFPLVVDSDPHKTGRFVPGTGQEIRPPDDLLAQPPDIIVITTQWRARDIAEEIRRRGIDCGELYTVQGGKLAPLAA